MAPSRIGTGTFRSITTFISSASEPARTLGSDAMTTIAAGKHVRHFIPISHTPSCLLVAVSSTVQIIDDVPLMVLPPVNTKLNHYPQLQVFVPVNIVWIGEHFKGVFKVVDTRIPVDHPLMF
jgi:hypothetical protein